MAVALPSTVSAFILKLPELMKVLINFSVVLGISFYVVSAFKLKTTSFTHMLLSFLFCLYSFF